MKIDWQMGDSYLVIQDHIPPKYARSKNRVLQAGKIVRVVGIHSGYHVTMKEIDSRYKFVIDPSRDSSWVRFYLKKIPRIISKEDQRLANLLFSKVF